MRTPSGRDAAWTWALAIVAAICIGSVRAQVAGMHARVKETSDAYFLPPPKDMVTLSLGYRAAVADVLWAHVLVSQGLHTFERRRFEHLTLLLDSINELDPTFREPYMLADALITIQAAETPREEVLKAREIMERGTRNRPLDGELWLAAGQFIAFIGPGSHLTDPDEQREWREAGAQMLARAAELGGANAGISWQALAGAAVYHRAGNREAEIRLYQRTLAVTDDEELRADLQRKLDALLGERDRDAYRKRQTDFAELWRRDLPFASKTTVLLLGPPQQGGYCAGDAHQDEPRCALTWRHWAERLEKQSDSP
jgi:hypothetical protein